LYCPPAPHMGLHSTQIAKITALKH
jgi:hypothetical protein